MNEFEDRVALVTGAASGIGRTVAVEFARAGSRVVAADLSGEGASETARIIGAQFGDLGIPVEMNVSDARQVKQVVEQVEKGVGPISFLANCAGVSTMAPFLQLSEADWDSIMDVNAKGVFLVTQAVMGPMVGRKEGCVVSIASAAGKEGVPFLAHYSASKWAVIGLTQTIAREMARYQIRVNAVCPGCVRTPMQDREVVWEGRLRGIPPEEVRQGYVEHTPLGRLGETQDVADVIMFLCSEKARFMTGQAINVTGGLVMH